MPPIVTLGCRLRGNALLRYALWNAPEGGVGTVVLLTGRGEFIEKYASEVIGELLQRGFAVAALDWRGQGLSDRPLPEHDAGHIDTFATYIADLRLFLDTIVAPDAAQPVMTVCHSMGGHIVLRYLGRARTGPPGGRHDRLADDRPAPRDASCARC